MKVLQVFLNQHLLTNSCQHIKCALMQVSLHSLLLLYEALLSLQQKEITD